MSAAELNKIKLDLIAWIKDLSDENVLTFMNGIRQSQTPGDWWDELSEGQKEAIRTGLKDMEAGRVMESKAFLKRLKNGR